MDDCHLLHMAINMNISLRTCEQLRIGSLLKLTEHYDFYRHYEIRGLLEASAMLLCVERRSNLEYSLKVRRLFLFSPLDCQLSESVPSRVSKRIMRLAIVR